MSPRWHWEVGKLPRNGQKITFVGLTQQGLTYSWWDEPIWPAAFSLKQWTTVWAVGLAHAAECLLLPVNSWCWPGAKPPLPSAQGAGSGVGSTSPKWGCSSHPAQILTYPTGNTVLSCIMAVWLAQWQKNWGNMLHFSQVALQTMAKVDPWCWQDHLAGNTCVSAQGIAHGRWMSSSWWRTEAGG